MKRRWLGWDASEARKNFITIMDRESSKDSQMKMLETQSSNGGEGACPSACELP